MWPFINRSLHPPRRICPRTRDPAYPLPFRSTSRGFTCCSDRVVRSIVVLSVYNVVYAPDRARCALCSMEFCSRICLVLLLVISGVCGHRRVQSPE